MADVPRIIPEQELVDRFRSFDLDPVHLAAYAIVVKQCRAGKPGASRKEIGAGIERSPSATHRVLEALERRGMVGRRRDGRTYLFCVDLGSPLQPAGATSAGEDEGEEPPEHLSELKWSKPKPAECCMTCQKWYPGRPGMVHGCTGNRHPLAGKSPGERCTYYTAKEQVRA